MSMIYRLTEELMNARFPLVEIHNLNDNMGKISSLIDGKLFVFPTISELIEACGDRFYSLYRHGKDEWQVNSNSDQWDIEISHGKYG